MISLTNDNEYDAIVPVQSERIHPLLALYHRRSLVQMKKLLAKKESKLRLLLDEIRVQTVAFTGKDHDFININFREDWQKYKDTKLF